MPAKAVFGVVYQLAVMARKILHIGLQNVRAHKGYACVCIALAAACFLSLSLFRQYMTDVLEIGRTTWAERFMYGHVIIEVRGERADKLREPWRFVLDKRAQAWTESFLGQDPEVFAWTPFLTSYGSVRAGKAEAAMWIRGVDPARGAAMRGDAWRWDATTGAPLQQGNGTDQILIGVQLAELLGCEVPRPEGLNRFGYPAEVRPFHCPKTEVKLSAATAGGGVNSVQASVLGTVSGGFNEIDEMLVVVPLRLAQELLATDTVSYYTVALKHGDAASIAAFSRRFKAAGEAGAAAGPRPLVATTWQDHPDGDFFARGQETLAIFRAFFDGLMLAIAAFSLYVTLLKAYSERDREIGVLRVLGYHSEMIVLIFTGEAAILAALGVGLGFAATLALSYGVNALAIPYNIAGLTEPLPFRFAYQPGIYLYAGCAVASLLVGVAAAVTVTLLRRPVMHNLQAA